MDPITFTRTDGSTFSLTPRMPRSYAVRNDLLSAYNDASTRGDAARVNRVLAATIGVCVQGRCPPSEEGVDAAPVMPSYDMLNAEVMRYGGRVIETLMGEWDVVPTAEMYRTAIRWTVALSESMPRLKIVEEVTNFTSANEGLGTS